MFRPGQLTPGDARDLNAMVRQIAALRQTTVSTPMTISRVGGVASLGIDPLFLQGVILGEVTAVTSGDHTVKRLTWDSGIVDYEPLTEYESCRSATGSDLAVGTTVMVFPIPDVNGEYWIVPVWTFDEICEGITGCITDAVLAALCVTKDGDGFVTDVSYVDSADECVVVPECDDVDPPCGPADPPVPGDTCETAGDFSGAYFPIDDTRSLLGVVDDDKWYKFTAPSTGAYKLTLERIGDGSADTEYGVYYGDCGSQTTVSSSGIFLGPTCFNLGTLTMGTVYYVRVWNGTTTAVTYRVIVETGTC
jgi:hypothetical protein